MRLTWQLVTVKKLSFSEAIKKAWATLRLKAEMLLKPVSFFYRKGDGSERFAIGHYASATSTDSNSKTLNPLVVRYWDTLVNAWRSFCIERLITD